MAVGFFAKNETCPQRGQRCSSARRLPLDAPCPAALDQYISSETSGITASSSEWHAGQRTIGAVILHDYTGRQAPATATSIRAMPPP